MPYSLVLYEKENKDYCFRQINCKEGELVYQNGECGKLIHCGNMVGGVMTGSLRKDSGWTHFSPFFDEEYGNSSENFEFRPKKSNSDFAMPLHQFIMLNNGTIVDIGIYQCQIFWAESMSLKTIGNGTGIIGDDKYCHEHLCDLKGKA